MKFKDVERIIDNGSRQGDKEARKTALEILSKALEAADPRIAVKKAVKLEDKILKVSGLEFDLNRYSRILVVGGGKASGAMAEALEEIVGEFVEEGIVNIPKGTSKLFDVKKITLNEAGHPIPDEDGAEGVGKMLEILKDASEDTLVFCLISGGGSALLPKPVEGVELKDLQTLTVELLRCGAPIDEVNAVRKHLSQVKGGRLAAAAYPATLVTLLISDVVGDRLDTIASGPTAPDTTTFLDAKTILERYRVWDTAPESVKKILEAGCRGEIPETPKPGHPIFSRVYNVIVASNSVAVEEAEKYASAKGFNTVNLSSYIEGEARHVGYALAGVLKGMALNGKPVARPGVAICGGETTVTVVGDGVGGRNQELVLAASTKIKGLESVALASIGTDGVDGPTDAAGAIADGDTYRRALENGLKPEEYLDRNDSYSFFSNLGDLLVTGPTGTNVNDVMVLVVV